MTKLVTDQPLRHMFRKDVAAHFAHWAVRLSPYPCPDDLPEVLSDLTQALEARWPGEPYVFMPHDEVSDLLHEFIQTHPKVRLWNERKNGNSAPFQAVSIHFAKPDPDNDFIDLDALCRNVTYTLAEEERRNMERHMVDTVAAEPLVDALTPPPTA